MFLLIEHTVTGLFPWPQSNGMTQSRPSFCNLEGHVNYLYLSLMDHHHGQAMNQAVKTPLTHIKLMFRQWKM